jgi:hypothetical protein
MVHEVAALQSGQIQIEEQQRAAQKHVAEDHCTEQCWALRKNGAGSYDTHPESRKCKEKHLYEKQACGITAASEKHNIKVLAQDT